MIDGLHSSVDTKGNERCLVAFGQSNGRSIECDTIMSVWRVGIGGRGYVRCW